MKILYPTIFYLPNNQMFTIYFFKKSPAFGGGKTLVKFSGQSRLLARQRRGETLN
jgi:hypothetical protein